MDIEEVEKDEDDNGGNCKSGNKTDVHLLILFVCFI